MSLIPIPNETEFTSGEEKVFNKLKTIYSGTDYQAYLYLKPRIRNLEPDFILIDPYKGVCIIEVKDWSLSYISNINRLKVNLKTGKVDDNPAFKANQYFNLTKGLFESDIRLLNDNADPCYNLSSVVILPNMTIADHSKLGDVLNQPPSRIILSEKFKVLNQSDLFGTSSCYINDGQLLVLRSILFPEIKIIDFGNFDAEDIGNSDEILSTIKALDSTQEQFAKRIPNGHYMVSGVPGSGKTVILLSRAIHLLKENPSWKIKIVTYNRSLARKLENRMDMLSSDFPYMGIDKTNISISTFHKLALDLANIGVPQYPSEDFWTEELPRQALTKAYPIYDAVLIDEYQDFYDDWIRVCIKVCKKLPHDNEQKENIFLAGDRLQSIYNPREHSWEQLGIKIRGRSKLLKHTYRSGKSHIELALRVLLTDKALKKEVELFYEGKDGIDNETSIMSEIQFLEGGTKTIADLLHNLINIVGYKYEDIMVLFPSMKIAQQFYTTLPPQIQANSKVTKEIIEKTLIITTYHSSKGLESRICIMANVDSITELKLLYVAMTRASQRLYIHALNFANSTIAHKIKEGNLIEADTIEANISDNLHDLRNKKPIIDIADDLPF
jgi:hypothetical protein